MLDLKIAQRYLMLNFVLMIALCLLIVVLYECEILVSSDLSNNTQLVFFLQIVMEFASIIVIPVALKLFAFKPVRRRLLENKGTALLRWGTARIQLLCVPMLVDTLLYYQTMWAGFGYLGIILLLCLFFVYPSMGRCIDETSEPINEQ